MQREAVYQLIEENKFDRAFEALKQQALGRDQTAYADLVLLQSRYNRYRQEQINQIQSYETMSMTINSITKGLIDLVTMNESLFAEGSPAEVREWKAQFTKAVKQGGYQMLEISESLREKHDYGEQHYLLDWLRTNLIQLSKEVTHKTFDVLGPIHKDSFAFATGLQFALRFVFKSYLNQAQGWLKEPGFIFDFEQFTKAEVRVALLLLGLRIENEPGIRSVEKAGILNTIELLDSGVKNA